MQVSSVPAYSKIVSCQPIRKNNDFNFAMPFKSAQYNEQGDSAQLSSQTTLEEKYDFACRLAAFYKNQYEALKTQGSVQV